jgi:hypothetical protein
MIRSYIANVHMGLPKTAGTPVVQVAASIKAALRREARHVDTMYLDCTGRRLLLVGSETRMLVVLQLHSAFEDHV